MALNIFYSAYAIYMLNHYYITYKQTQDNYLSGVDLRPTKNEWVMLILGTVIHFSLYLFNKNLVLPMCFALGAAACSTPIARGRRFDYFLAYSTTYYVFDVIKS